MKNKILNLEKLALTRDELKKVTGGLKQYSCQCNGTGTWTGSYGSNQEVVDAINKYCSNGGTCS